jgi:polysaccharide chain length determinant protein (PEP-CTERM system associated)
MPDLAQRSSGVERLLQVWRRRKWLAIVVFAAVFAAITAAVTRLPDIYRSTATVLVERRQMAETFIRPTITGEVETRLQTISQEILSRARLEKVIARFGLYPGLTSRVRLAAVVDRMRKDIQLESKGTEAIGGRATTIAFSLSYRGRDPETVALVTNTLASSYVEENSRQREQQASGTAAFLRGQLAEVKARMDMQEQRVREFRARNIGELPQQLGVNLATVERLHAQLHLSSANQLRAMDRRAQLVKELRDVDPSGSAGPSDARTARIVKLKQELLDLRRHFGERYPDVVEAKRNLEALERDLAEDQAKGIAVAPQLPSADPSAVRLRAALDAVDAEIAALKADEQKLRSDITAYQRRAESAPQRELELQELSRDNDMTKELYTSLLKRYEDAQLAENMEQRRGGEEFRLLDPALPAMDPVAPNRPRLIVMGLLLSLGLAGLVVMLADQLDTSFHTADNLRAIVNVPILVNIPLIVTQADRRRVRWWFWGASASFAFALVLIVKAAQYMADGNDALVALLARGGS